MVSVSEILVAGLSSVAVSVENLGVGVILNVGVFVGEREREPVRQCPAKWEDSFHHRVCVCPSHHCAPLPLQRSQSCETMDGNTIARDAVKRYIGKPIVLHLTDGCSFRAFLHALDAASTIVCLELIPSAEVVLISATNIKSLAPLTSAKHSRSWPSNRTYSKPPSL